MGTSSSNSENDSCHLKAKIVVNQFAFSLFMMLVELAWKGNMANAHEYLALKCIKELAKLCKRLSIAPNYGVIERPNAQQQTSLSEFMQTNELLHTSNDTNDYAHAFHHLHFNIITRCISCGKCWNQICELFNEFNFKITKFCFS